MSMDFRTWLSHKRTSCVNYYAFCNNYLHEYKKTYLQDKQNRADTKNKRHFCSNTKSLIQMLDRVTASMTAITV